MYHLKKNDSPFNMFEVRFERSEPQKLYICNMFKYYVYMLMGYPYYMF